METDDVRNVRYRLSAKVVGCCDTVCSCVAAILFILGFLMRSVVIYDTVEEKSGSKFENDTGTGEVTFKLSYKDITDTRIRLSDQFGTYIWASVTINLVVTVIQIGVSTMLIKASSTGRTPKSAQKWVKLYVFFNASVLLVYLVWRIVDKYWAGLLIGGFLRFAFLIIAGLYLRKLRHITMANQQSKVEAGKEHGMTANGKIVPVSSLGTDTEETVY